MNGILTLPQNEPKPKNSVRFEDWKNEIYEKVKLIYSNKYMLFDFNMELIKIDSIKKLDSFENLSAKEIVIIVLGEDKLEKYYPSEMYVSEEEYRLKLSE